MFLFSVALRTEHRASDKPCKHSPSEIPSQMVLLFHFEAESPLVAWTDLEFVILLPQSPESGADTDDVK